MKSYRKLLILPAVAALAATAMVGCSEDATLSGAKAVYIELTPSSKITLHLEDTVRVSARVTNVNGDEINTPVRWAVDDNSAFELIADSVAGSTLITCGDGAQGKSTSLRAILENDDYAVTTVSVVKATPAGVNAVDEEGNLLTDVRSWKMGHDSVIFAVSPKQLLLDYDAVCDFDGLEPYGDNGGIVIDKKHGEVIMHFSTDDIAKDYHPSVTVGSGAIGKKGSVAIHVIPPIEGATFYGPAFANMPNIGTRPPQGTLSMWYSYEYQTTMDVNSVDTVRVAFNISSGLKHDIEQAYGSYRWECVEGSSVMKVLDTQVFVENNGFDAVLAVRSGLSTGTSVYHCITPDTVLVATFNVRNFVEEFPVNSITCSMSSIETATGAMNAVAIKMGTVPMSSFGYHKPKCTVDDPSIVSVSDYMGDELVVTGLKPGKTNLRFTSNKAPELVVPVTITESYRVITYTRTDTQIIFAGQEATWNTNVETASGLPNTQQVTFTSADASIATVANISGSLDQATVKGVAAGKAMIKAEVGGVSVERQVTVVAPDASTTFTDGTGMQLNKSGKNMYLRLPSNARLTFNNAYVSSNPYIGTFQVADYEVEYSLSNAKAKVVSGYMTIAAGSASNKKLVSFNLVVQLADGVTLTYSGSNIEVESK